MLSARLLIIAFFCLATAALLPQAPPTEYATFDSQGKAVSCAVYDAGHAKGTIVFLRGADSADLALARAEASYFAGHGFRVLLPDYMSVTPSAKATAANYRRWGQVVQDIVANLRAHPTAENKKIGLAGQAQGASVALVAASLKLPVDAMAEWSGLLPNQFFSQVQSLPPLLILHGEQDTEVPIVNARQLIRLCELKDFTCEIRIFAGEGHVFSSDMLETANRRALAFFETYLR